ncbi:MAG: hypothetical protein KAI45_10835, partial [Melioribacteraceae bacterium]|nr:hypothetical protein [Melioribacteraceae bacterium]
PDLMLIPFMDIESAANIINHRKKHGKFFSTREIKMIDGLSSNISKTLQYFVIVKPPAVDDSPPFIGMYSLKFRSRLINDIQERKGFIDTIYSGSAIKAYNRIKFQPNPKISMGGLIEKDAGENSYWDFYSAHLSMNDLIPYTNIIVGDYTVEFGQGLSMWSPYSFSKSSDATNSVIKRGRNISPYTSSGETNFLRGAVANARINNLSITAFYSNLYLDATIDDGSSSFSAIRVDGFHRTVNELSKINRVKDKTIGASLAYSILDKVNLGVLHYQKSFSHNFDPENYSSINGDQFQFTSLSYDAMIKNIFFVGELAYSQNSFATINTIQLALVKNFIITAIVRNYPKDYFSFYANGFGEKSTTNNEFGIYTGFKWKTSIGEINFYLDQFKFPHPSSHIPLPSSGDELSFSYANRFSNGIKFYIRYFNEKKEVQEIVDQDYLIVEQKLQKIRGEVTFQVNRALRFRTRLELLYLSRNQTSINETGFLIFQDLQLKLPIDLTLIGRVIFFQTDSYASRIYEFENDLTGVMNNLALYGTGMRWYFLLRYKLMQTINLSFKYSELYKPNEEVLGSGYSLIPGNLDNRISLQIDLSF